MHLPYANNLPTQLLAAVFKKTTATYKYYWFLGLIECVEEGKLRIPKKELFAKMIANAWYTIHYFHLSFGKGDILHKHIEDVLAIENLTIDEHKKNIVDQLINSKNAETNHILKHFDKNVPHRFLSPWFEGASEKEVYQLSQQVMNNCLYSLYKYEIIVNPIWEEYIKNNAKILKDFCYWNLSIFLQSKNPNVPDIPNKLIKPAKRNNLQKQLKNYWQLVFEELGSIECIFTNQVLNLEDNNFALDHFVPYAFVSHDLIWNLIPIDRSFNARKSDKLPPFDTYFSKFNHLQKIAFEIHLKNGSKSKIMEEYLTIFPNITIFDEKLMDQTIRPLITIANNNGFTFFNDK